MEGMVCVCVSVCGVCGGHVEVLRSDAPIHTETGVWGDSVSLAHEIFIQGVHRAMTNLIMSPVRGCYCWIQS